MTEEEMLQIAGMLSDEADLLRRNARAGEQLNPSEIIYYSLLRDLLRDGTL